MNMNYRLLIQKTYAAFLMVLVVTAFSFASVVATGTTTNESTQGEITSFGFNNPTVVSGLRILGTDNSDTETLSRSESHKLQFDVRDVDGFDHLDVYIVLYKSDNKTTDSGLALQYINSGVSDDALVLRWIAPERSVYLSGLDETFLFPITSGADNFLVKSGAAPLINTYNSGVADFKSISDFNAQSNVTWNIDDTPSSTEIESGIVTVYDGDNEDSSGVRIIKRQITIPITISKVLPLAGSLNYAIIVYDRLQQEITTSKTGDVFGYHADNGIDYDVQFYGEIEITTSDPSVVFSGVSAGNTSFTESQAVIEAKFISNGTYKQSFSSDSTWKPDVVTTGLPDFAYIVPASGLLEGNDPGDFLSSEGNRFALRAFRETIAGNGSATEPIDLRLDVTTASGAQVVSKNAMRETAGGRIYAENRSDSAVSTLDAVISTADPTTELGVISAFRFQIKLSPVFQTNHILNGVVQTTEYTGTIRLLISNG
jgi:hypothetical protein